MRKRKLFAGVLAAAAPVAVLGWFAKARPDAAVNTLEPALAFRIVFGTKRAGPRVYDGSVTVTSGKVRTIAPWRFFGDDAILAPASWKLTIKRAPLENQPNAPVRVSDGAVVPLNWVPAGLIITVDPSITAVAVHTSRGDFEIPARRLQYGNVLTFLDGDVAVERVPATFEISTGKQEQHDYPSLTVTRGGAVWIAWQAYRDRGDQLYVRRMGGAAERLTTRAADLFGSAIAEDARGRIHVVWSERSGEEWHLWERVREGAAWTAARRITTVHSPNIFHKLAASPSGVLWLVWTGYDGGASYLYASRLESSGWSAPRNVGGPGVWSPDAVADRDGNLLAAWDSYTGGNYDIYFRRLPEAARRVTSSPRFEAHPSLTLDAAGRPWLAWDESGANWGKDWNRDDQNRGLTLYTDRSIRVAVLNGNQWMQAGEFESAVPEHLRRYAQLPRLAADGAGRVWLLFQLRTSAESTHDDSWSTGGLWDLYLTSYENGAWRPAAFVPNSTARPEAPARITGAPGGVWMAWPTDGRTYRGRSGNHELASMVHYDLFAAYASSSAPSGKAELSELSIPAVRPQAVHPDEDAAVARIRAYRTTAAGVTYRILRGDFHRHTEISYDGAGDGSLEDYYRYMLDAAAMDTGIIADHNMGGDAEYSWWRTEKSYDVFHIRGRFTPLFGYERSVRYPNGHRNIIFDHRGVRTLPIGADENAGKVNSGPILYPYLRQNRGICLDHSMATGQGTDYRDNDPELEPLVEIYQGYHASAEYAGAPRAESESRQVTLHGPFRPAGFWWNALAKGLKLGVHASSDHISTHSSYAMIYTPGDGRAEIVESMRSRHAYGATDNIIVDFQSEGRLMGDAFRTKAKPALHARVIGTAPITAVDLIRNGEFIYSQRPGKPEAEFTYTDIEPREGENWYYVRVVQQDGNLAWSSPIWITVLAGN